MNPLMNPLTHYLTIAVPAPLWQSFDYLPPEDADIEIDWPPGIRILVPFGRRVVLGILLGVSFSTTVTTTKLKTAIKRLDEQPLLTPKLLELCQWVSQYYQHPLGEVISHVLPKWLRSEKVLPPCKPTDPYSAATTVLHPTEITLNTEQQQVINSINATQGYATFLLDGITGSGKTEVYFQCIATYLARGKQALVLVPEIALTPQTVKRFQQRFCVPIVLLHSARTDRQRALAWLQASRGEAAIIIGTRSAIFTPLANPGIIILDEEHDTSFKQQSGLRYSARDCAIMRARLEDIPVILGSATPSLESLYNCQRQRYQHLRLTQRAGIAKPPQVSLIDLRKQRLIHGISKPLLAKIAQHLANNNQVMLFLNRRGYAPVLLCHQCGWTAQCTHCDARLTLHLSAQRLFCHHCDATKAIPSVCEQCKQSELVHVGQGTERLEQTIQEQFPEAKIVRIDRDNTRRKDSMQQLLSKVHNAEANILIGTQMLGKGHHFPKLTLVAIIDADSGLYSNDFRALERMAQLLIQVAGRAGRSEHVGEVLIQTHQPEHPLLILLLQHGYGKFAQVLLKERKEAKLPPYHYFALLRCDAKSREAAFLFLNQIKQLLTASAADKVTILGPIAATMERRANQYHAQLLLQSPIRQHLQALLQQTVMRFNHCAQAKQIRWSLDVDPQDLY